jgi:hydrogenase-4 component B
VATGVWIYPTNMIQALISPPLVLILILGTLLIPPLIIYLYGGFKAGRKTVADPWACGYGYSPEMSISANSFDQPVHSTFRSIYWLRTILDMPLEKITGWAKRIKEFAVMREGFIEHGVTEPIFHAVDYLGKRFQQLQMGDIRMYCLYIILTLAILLIVVFR